MRRTSRRRCKSGIGIGIGSTRLGGTGGGPASRSRSPSRHDAGRKESCSRLLSTRAAFWQTQFPAPAAECAVVALQFASQVFRRWPGHCSPEMSRVEVLHMR